MAMDRKTIFEHLRTGLLVTLVTVLIWTFAEGQSLQTKRSSGTIDFASGRGETFSVSVLDNPSNTNSVQLQLQMEGSAARLDRLIDELRKPITLVPGMENIPRQPGQYTIDIRQALRSTQLLKESGVTLIAVQPATVQVAIDSMTTITLPVKVEVPSNELDGQAEPSPAQVEIRLPTEKTQQLSKEAAVVVRISHDDLAPFEAGHRVTLRGLRIEPGPALAGIKPLELTTSSVDVSLTVRSKLKSITLPTVPVDLRIPPDELKRWVVQIPVEEQSLQNVTVTGPSELIEQIKDGQLAIRAFVRLSFEDLEAQIPTKRAEFSELPSALRFRVENWDVHLHITKREPKTTPAGTPATPSP